MVEASELAPEPVPELDEAVVGDVLRRAARLGPDDPLLTALDATGADVRWTAAGLLRDAESVARALLRDHPAGAPIATCLTNGPEVVLLQLGVALAGMVLVPVNPQSRPAELAHALRLAGAVRLYRRGGPPLGPGVDPDIEVVELDGRPEVLLDGGASDVRLPVVDPDSLAQIQFTSGTTGLPKGVRIHHRGMVQTSFAFAERLGLPEGGVWVDPMPQFHTAGNVLGTLGALWQCAEHVVLPFTPAAAVRAVAERGATVLSAAPTLLHLMAAEPGFDDAARDRLRVVFTGGSTLTPTVVEEVERRFGAALAVTFGMTETCGSALLTAPLADPVEVRRTTVGRPLAGTGVRVVDPAGAVVPRGETGELLLRGDRLTRGYHDDPAATAAAIDPDGWLHTGDLAAMDADGRLRIVGRLKDMIKTGGENVSPEEVEDVIAAHPAVARAAVVGAPDPRWGELVVGFVVPAPGSAVDPDELTAHCRARLSPFKVPRRWHLLDELPLTASSKVQRAELRRRAVISP
jgi:fatty-acyl-CoA synthase